MKQIIPLCILLYCINHGQAQSYQTEEIRIRYSDGIEVFNICKSNPNQDYYEDKEYFWYTEFSDIKSTKGGTGGQLLHGNYKLYDQEGNLRSDKNYHSGLQHGKHTKWDSNGNISSKKTYDKGKMVYWKFMNDEDYWIEFNGGIFDDGTIRKVYSEYGKLLSEELNLKDFKQKIKVYYEESGKLKQEFYAYFREFLFGKYVTFYENGNITVLGQYVDAPFYNVRVGTWKWYNSDGTLDLEEKYKADTSKWPNGEKKFAGGFIYDAFNDEWVKSGDWIWWDDQGKMIITKKYKWGAEINE